MTDNINNLVFAKEFFQIIDVNANGGLTLAEISIPLISLGLSSDSTFIKLLFRAINSSKFSNVQDYVDKKLTLREFT